MEAPRTCIASAIALARYLISTIFLITFPGRSPSGARNVLRAIHEAIAQIAVHPQSSVESSTAAIRVKILGRYRYKIFYRADDTSVEIVHVRHSAREPWTGGY